MAEKIGKKEVVARLMLEEMRTLHSKVFRMGFSASSEDVCGPVLSDKKGENYRRTALGELEKYMDQLAKRGKTTWTPLGGVRAGEEG